MITRNSEKINVLWIVDHLGYAGIMHGAGKYYQNTIPLFEKTKFDVTLCVLRRRDDLSQHFQEAGIRIHHLGRAKFDPYTFLDLIKFVKQKKIALIHTHGYGSSNFGRLIGVIRGIPTILHAHDEHFNYPWYQALADLLLSRFTTRAIAISQAVMISCINKRKIPKDRVRLIYNAIPLEKFKTPVPEEIEKEKRRLGIGLNVQVVGSVVKLTKEKGIEYLLKSAPRVLAAFPDTLFVIVGDGLLRKQLEALCNQLEIDQSVVFMGYQHDVSSLLSIFDIKVLPSLTEGFGLPVVEAMAMGKPIVSTNVGGLREILKDGITSYLVPAKDPQALADKIIHLLKNKTKAKQMGIRAKKDSRYYDIHLHVSNLEEEYNRLLNWQQ